MADFKFLNYHTEYSVSGTSNKEMAPEACFYYVFNGPGYLKNHYIIKIYKGLQMAKKSNDNNCFLSKIQLHHHISVLKNIYGFTFNIEEKINKDLIPYYELTLNINGPNIIHRFILTWIRYVYEHPYNLYVLDVYKLKTMDTFKYINPLNIFNIVACCANKGNMGHMFTCPGSSYKLLKYNWIKNKISERVHEGKYNLSNIFKCIEYNVGKGFDTSKLEDWNSKFINRVDSYIKVYKQIRKK